ncbi:glycoside hydrolase family 30 beta sandwich domain-containing protein [Cytobacillus firmus]
MRFTITAPTIILGISASSLSLGARRIGSQTLSNRILATAFENINGETVAVLMKENDREEEVSISLRGKSMMLVLPEHYIATVIIH